MAARVAALPRHAESSAELQSRQEPWIGASPYRTHPGWQFGLHAGNGEVEEGFGSIEPGTFTDDGAFANPFLGFARNGASIGYAAGGGSGAFRVAAFHGTAQYGGRRDADAGEAAGFLTEYRFGKHGVAVQGGWLAEAEAVVGGRPSGAFGGVAAESVIAGLSAPAPMRA